MKGAWIAPLARVALVVAIALVSLALADHASSQPVPLPEAELGAFYGAWGGGDPEPDPEPEPEPEPRLSIDGRTDIDVFPGQCVTSIGTSYDYRSTSSTRARPHADYLAAKTTLEVSGIVRGDSTLEDSRGPISYISDSVRHSVPCIQPFAPAVATGWHKGVLDGVTVFDSSADAR